MDEIKYKDVLELAQMMESSGTIRWPLAPEMCELIQKDENGLFIKTDSGVRIDVSKR